jgi:hypothetical protein
MSGCLSPSCVYHFTPTRPAARCKEKAQRCKPKKSVEPATPQAPPPLLRDPLLQRFLSSTTAATYKGMVLYQKIQIYSASFIFYNHLSINHEATSVASVKHTWTTYNINVPNTACTSHLVIDLCPNKNYPFVYRQEQQPRGSVLIIQYSFRGRNSQLP